MQKVQQTAMGEEARPKVQEQARYVNQQEKTSKNSSKGQDMRCDNKAPRRDRSQA